MDFLPVTSREGRDALVPVVGGSCLNIAIGMARLGAPAGFVGGISTDPFGGEIADHARASGVDLRYATRSPHQTTLAFVQMAAGEPRYAFYDQATASRNWTHRSGSVPFGAIDAIHVGSTTLVNEKGAAQTLAMVREARGSTTISFDPNCRPALVGDRAQYVERMNEFADCADIIRMSDVDFAFLYGSHEHARYAETRLAAGTGLVVVTRGGQGVQAWHQKTGAVEVRAPSVAVVDTVGAGDSFQAALLVGLRAIGRIDSASLAELDADELRRVLTFAVTCAALTCTRAGADPPRRADLGEDVFGRLVGGGQG